MNAHVPFPDAIEVSRDELQARIGRVCEGMSPDDVAGVLGGEPYETAPEGDGEHRFWRFRVENAPAPNRLELYMAQFEQDKLTFGSLLPHG